jgi:hypothetical protein
MSFEYASPAFSWESPEELMFEVALSRPVDFDALALVEETVSALVSDEDDAAPLYFDDEPLLYVCDVVLPFVLGAFLSLCMSPSARAEPLASRTTVERKTGASLRMVAS